MLSLGLGLGIAKSRGTGASAVVNHPPTLVSTSPTASATGVALDADIVLTFSEAVSPGFFPYAEIWGGSDDGTLIYAWTAVGTGPGEMSFSGSTLTLHNPGVDFPPSDSLLLFVADSTAQDADGELYAGLLGAGLGFTTTTGPAIAVPVNSVAPAISGNPTEGQTLTLTSQGTWSNSPTSYSQQWEADGTPISGAIGATFVVTGAEIGADITCDVVASNVGGAGTAATSNTLGPVAGLASAPAISSITYDDGTQGLGFAVDRACTVRLATIDDGGADPTKDQIAAGTGGGVYEGFTIAATVGGGPYSIDITSATPNGSRDIVFFAEDNANAALRSAIVRNPGSVTVSNGTSLEILQVEHAEADQSGSDITFATVPVDPTATTIVALFTCRGNGIINGVTIGGVSATLIGGISGGGDAVSRVRAYSATAPGGWTTADVVVDGASAGTGGGLLTLISVDGLTSASIASDGPANGSTSASASQDVLTHDVLYAHLLHTLALPTSLAWSGATEIRASQQIASDPNYGAVASHTVASDATGYSVGASWSNGVNNIVLGVLRLRGS